MLYKTRNLWKEGKNDFCMIVSNVCFMFWQKSSPSASGYPCSMPWHFQAFSNKAVHAGCSRPAAPAHTIPDLHRFTSSFFCITLKNLGNADSPSLWNLFCWRDSYKADYRFKTWILRCALCFQNGFWWLNENVCRVNFQLIFSLEQMLHFCPLQLPCF